MHHFSRAGTGTPPEKNRNWRNNRRSLGIIHDLSLLISCLSLHPKNDDWCSPWHGCWEGNRKALLSFKAEVKPLRKNRGNVNYQLSLWFPHVHDRSSSAPFYNIRNFLSFRQGFALVTKYKWQLVYLAGRTVRCLASMYDKPFTRYCVFITAEM